VAAVTGVLADRGCNLQDSSMTTLQGQFAILLVVAVPEASSASSLELALQPVAEQFDLVVVVRSLPDDRPPAPEPPAASNAMPGDAKPSVAAASNAVPGHAQPSVPTGHAKRSPRPPAEPDVAPGETAWVVAVHGADHPGIVHGIATVLAEAGGSIVDLTTHLVGDEPHPLYTLTMRAVIPSAVAARTAELIEQAARRLGVHCTVHDDPADVL
jgi:predicted amino acid-binding ACT domain protein